MIHMLYISQKWQRPILTFIRAKNQQSNKGIIAMFCRPYLLLLHITWFLFNLYNNIIALNNNTNTKDDSYGMPPLMAVNSIINIINNSCNTQQIGDIPSVNWFMSHIFTYHQCNNSISFGIISLFAYYNKELLDK